MNKVSRNVVWSDPRAEQPCGEELGNQNDADFKIANDLADKIAGIVTNGYSNRDIVKNLISNSIREQIRQYLREYDNVAAEDMLNSLKGWKLGDLKGWTSEVDFDHARHGKLSSFGDEVAELINKYKAENQLQRVREQILNFTPEPDSITENNDGQVWISNVLTIIDDELGIGKEVPEETDDEVGQSKSPGISRHETDEENSTKGIINFNDDLDDDEEIT